MGTGPILFPFYLAFLTMLIVSNSVALPLSFTVKVFILIVSVETVILLNVGSPVCPNRPVKNEK